ncbi:hypothetical protein BDBG_09237 [Blastomyces gilchristii SLH14081]|uniref:Uncharacterized protein n=1 Tax=Blastomyces gilchristii (strain SLH14081) TaxID=559298 RepID=A0A179V1E9_BLAGS|nr:uncharacterized protein BDBG_09237 [Blastomyces gilchristii SLH14081]OAT14164.1 hypothetical protein BDBG_09237 [Blastomyces gilchristii SLH14081]
MLWRDCGKYLKHLGYQLRLEPSTCKNPDTRRMLVVDFTHLRSRDSGPYLSFAFYSVFPTTLAVEAQMPRTSELGLLRVAVFPTLKRRNLWNLCIIKITGVITERAG